MSEDITDANDCIVQVGSSQGGGTDGRLVISQFDIDVSKNLTRKYGIGNRDAVGRTQGNREIDLTFTHEGEAAERPLLDEIEEGNFNVRLLTPDHRYRIRDVDGSFTLSVDDEEFTIDFDGHGLSFQREER